MLEVGAGAGVCYSVLVSRWRRTGRLFFMSFASDCRPRLAHCVSAAYRVMVCAWHLCNVLVMRAIAWAGVLLLSEWLLVRLACLGVVWARLLPRSAVMCESFCGVFECAAVRYDSADRNQS